MIRSEEHVRQSLAYWALNNTIRETDRANYVEHLNEVFEIFASETNTFEDKFGKMTDEEKTLAVKKLMPEGLLISTVRGTKLSHCRFLFALDNIIVDKVLIVPTDKAKM